MSDAVNVEDSIEGTRSHELVRDEDVLSHDLQRELEAIGSGLGVIGVVALFAAALPRARKLLDRTPFAKGHVDG